MQIREHHFSVKLQHPRLQKLERPGGQTAHLNLIWKLSSTALYLDGESLQFSQLQNYCYYCSTTTDTVPFKNIF